MKTWNAIIVVLSLAAMPSTGGAQGIAKNLDELRLIVRAGERVSVIDLPGNAVSGKILSLSPSSLTLEVAGRPREFQEGDISRIMQRRGDSLGNGALWGLGVGAGLATVGVATAAASDDFEEEEAGWAALAIGLYGGIGAGIGVGIDALITRQQLIFERPAGATSVNLIPLLTGGRRGALLRITF
jgi:hypothetical protein